MTQFDWASVLPKKDSEGSKERFDWASVLPQEEEEERRSIPGLFAKASGRGLMATPGIVATVAGAPSYVTGAGLKKNVPGRLAEGVGDVLQAPTSWGLRQFEHEDVAQQALSEEIRKRPWGQTSEVPIRELSRPNPSMYYTDPERASELSAEVVTKEVPSIAEMVLRGAAYAPEVAAKAATGGAALASGILAQRLARRSIKSALSPDIGRAFSEGFTEGAVGFQRETGALLGEAAKVGRAEKAAQIEEAVLAAKRAEKTSADEILEAAAYVERQEGMFPGVKIPVPDELKEVVSAIRQDRASGLWHKDFPTAPPRMVEGQAKRWASEIAEDRMTGTLNALREEAARLPKAASARVTEEAAEVAKVLKKGSNPKAEGAVKEVAEDIRLAAEFPGSQLSAVIAAKLATYGMPQFSKFVSRTRQVALNLKFGKEGGKGIQGDLIALREGTGNPFRGADDTLEAVQKRIKDKGLWDDALVEMTRGSENSARLLAELNEVSIKTGTKTVDPVDNYLMHLWTIPRGKEAAARKYLRNLQEKGGFEEHRVFSTYFEAVHGKKAAKMREEGLLPPEGMKPKYDSYAAIQAAQDEAYGKVLATKRMVAEMLDIEKRYGAYMFARGEKSAIDASKKTGKDFVPFDMPLLGKASPGEGKMYAHPDIADMLKGLMTEQSYGKLDKAIAITKQMNFAFSLFHGFALSESAVLSLGPIKGLIQAAKGGFGIPGVARLLHKNGIGTGRTKDFLDALFVRGEARAAERLKTTGREFKQLDDLVEQSPAIRQIEEIVPGEGRIYYDPQIADGLNTLYRAGVEESMSRNALQDTLAHLRASLGGVQIGTPQTDTFRSAFDTVMDSLAKGAEKKFGKAGGAFVRGIDSVRREINFSLWEHLHDGLKVYTYNTLLDRAMALRAGKGGKFSIIDKKKLQEMTEPEIAQSVGKFVNDEFGGQAWALHTGNVMPHIARNEARYRKIAISPDWNVSSVRANLAGIDPYSDPVRRWLGIKHYANGVLGLYLPLNVANYALTKATTGEGRLMIENEPGKKFHLDTGLSGDARFIRMFKQLQELPNLIGIESSDIPDALMEGGYPLRSASREHMWNTWTGKSNRYLQAVVELFSGHSSSGFPSPVTSAERKAASEGEQLGGAERRLREAQTVLKAWSPFSMGAVARGTRTARGEAGELLGEGEYGQAASTLGKGAIRALPGVGFPVSRGMSEHRASQELYKAYLEGNEKRVNDVFAAMVDNDIPLSKANRLLINAARRAAKMDERGRSKEFRELWGRTRKAASEVR